MSETHEHRSLFWPIMLISIGLIALMSNLGLISSVNVIALLNVWPVLLIVIGLDLLFGRQSRLVGVLLGLGTVALAFVIMLVGPSLGLAGNWQIQRFNDSVPIDGVESAQITLNLTFGETYIHSMEDSPDLLTADLRYLGGDVVLEDTGSETKVVSLGQRETSFNISGPFGIFGWLLDPDREDLRWDIGLHQRVPLELSINGGLGNNHFDLTGLRLRMLAINGGAGDMTLHLPNSVNRYTVQIDGGVGKTAIVLPDDADIDLHIDGSAGAFTIDVPEGAAVRLEKTGGAGSVDAPAGFERIGGGEQIFDQGVWQTAGFDEAERRIEIVIDGGLGSITLN